MAFEYGLDMAWVLILALIILATMIGFYLYFRPSVAGGWFSNLAAMFKWFATPP